MKKIILTLSCIFMLVACEPQLQKIEPEFDRSNESMQIRIVTHNTEKELNDAYNRILNIRGKDRSNIKREGWSGWNLTEPYYCEIHVLKLKGLNDPQMTTWGHELAHCVYGTYHKDGER